MFMKTFQFRKISKFTLDRVSGDINCRDERSRDDDNPKYSWKTKFFVDRVGFRLRFCICFAAKELPTVKTCRLIKLFHPLLEKRFRNIFSSKCFRKRIWKILSEKCFRKQIEKLFHLLSQKCFRKWIEKLFTKSFRKLFLVYWRLCRVSRYILKSKTFAT